MTVIYYPSCGTHARVHSGKDFTMGSLQQVFTVIEIVKLLQSLGGLLGL